MSSVKSDSNDQSTHQPPVLSMHNGALLTTPQPPPASSTTNITATANNLAGNNVRSQPNSSVDYQQIQQYQQNNQGHISSSSETVPPVSISSQKKNTSTWEYSHTLLSKGMQTATPQPAGLMGTHISVGVQFLYTILAVHKTCLPCVRPVL